MLIAVGMPHRSLYLVTRKLSNKSAQLFISVARSALQEAVALHWSQSRSIKSLWLRWLDSSSMRAPASWAVPVRKLSSPVEPLPGFPTTHCQVMHYEKQHRACCWQDNSSATAVLGLVLSPCAVWGWHCSGSSSIHWVSLSKEGGTSTGWFHRVWCPWFVFIIFPSPSPLLLG